MKISEVKELLNQDNISEEILNELKKDERSGVQKLLISYAKKQEKKRPMVIYKADNAGSEVFGKVVEKGRHGKMYTITIRDYGIFVVTREQYEKIRVGDEVRI